MKAKVLGLISKIAPVFASLALLVAVSNVNSTCLFMAYQPDVPEELKK